MRFAQANMIRQNAPTEKREILEGIGAQQGACRGGVEAAPYYAQVPMTRAITTLAAMALRGGMAKLEILRATCMR